MIPFLFGIATAAILFALPEESGRFLVFVAVSLLVFLNPWKRSVYFAGGLAWFSFWHLEKKPRICDDFYWFMCHSESMDEPAYQLMESSWFGIYLGDARAALEHLCISWDPLWGPWALGLIGGKLDTSQQGLLDIYRQLGLIHVLVISGSHFTFLSQIGLLGVCWPSRLLYVCRRINFRTWFALHLLERSLVWLLLGFYGLVVGFPPPCQRAFIMGLLTTWWPLVRGNLAPGMLLKLSAFGQAFFFPLSFLSLSNVLSWSALTIIQKFTRSHQGWTAFFQRELAISCLALSYFGKFSPLGIILNPLLEPIWNSVLLMAIVGISGGGEWVAPILTVIHRALDACRNFQQQNWSADSLIWSGHIERIARILVWMITLTWLFRVEVRPKN